MTRYLVLQRSLVIAVALFANQAAHGEELARISTHSQRYGGEVEISAYDDPLLKGVTCYLSRNHEDNRSGNAQTRSMSQADVSCHQVGKLSVSGQVPKQAIVFDESRAPIFKALHVIRILDSERLVMLYLIYTESELAGDLPGHVDVI
ncbi:MULTISPECIES: CreA family protein [Caballeronia]|uniref:CreA family protein n=1 Tax=Caballeronia TaxID=1827195 RepID=UPI001FCFDD26|nr:MULTISPECIES: CreA family protein [Caballeronia]MDR5799224.1 CreA family protein [Caballeronia sp. LZ001]